MSRSGRSDGRPPRQRRRRTRGVSWTRYSLDDAIRNFKGLNVPDKNKNAKVIIPLAIGACLLGMLVFQSGAPAAVGAVSGIAMFAAIAIAVFYLMAEQGWSTLARRFRSPAPFSGTWQACPTAQMGLVSVDDPEFNQQRLRLVRTLRIGTAPDALYLSML